MISLPDSISMSAATPTEPVREPLIDPWWRKARIAARLIHKREAGRPWSARDRRLARRFAEDPGVTNRLIDQAWWSIRARRLYGPGILGWFN
jgi:hypothetical protein